MNYEDKKPQTRDGPVWPGVMTGPDRQVKILRLAGRVTIGVQHTPGMTGTLDVMSGKLRDAAAAHGDGPGTGIQQRPGPHSAEHPPPLVADAQSPVPSHVRGCI